ncbi:DNA primase catalytic subunit PriS [Halobacteriales archaeon QH_8_67_36]|nr:MAG: DNA primase catalytic subunit PriS [Halobacteriales archaeon QH_8_67_36]
MDERTREYLRGRFGDHYRRSPITPPPAANEREWGFIPWTEGPGETMVRHRSLLDLGNIEDFLARRKPRHIYFSAGRYDDPSASTMGDKGWRDSDLVFDLDADHLPSVVLGEDSYAEMLGKCKDALMRLLDFIDDDFGFGDTTVVFSGGRGYHVHVRDERIRGLERDARREIVDYVRGIGLEFDELVEVETVAGTAGRSSPAEKRTLPTDGGWGARAHRHVLSQFDGWLEMDEADAVEALQRYDRIGEGKATAALNAARDNYDELAAGNIDVHSAVYRIAQVLAQEAVAADNAPIDEPVTTDTNRLIRLPGSLHGGSGLEVKRLDRDELADFDPLVDAVPETFTGHEIAVEVTDGGLVELYTEEHGGDSFTVEPGHQAVPEHVGVFLMARGRARKAQE